MGKLSTVANHRLANKMINQELKRGGGGGGGGGGGSKEIPAVGFTLTESRNIF